MFWADHPPPHFHAIYGEYEAVIDILTSEIIQGQLPPESTQFGCRVDQLAQRRTARGVGLGSTFSATKTD